MKPWFAPSAKDNRFYLQVAHQRNAQLAQSTVTPGTLVKASMPTYNEVRPKMQQVAIATNLIRLLFCSCTEKITCGMWIAAEKHRNFQYGCFAASAKARFRGSANLDSAQREN